MLSLGLVGCIRHPTASGWLESLCGSFSISSLLDTFVVGCPVIGDPLSGVDRWCTRSFSEIICSPCLYLAKFRGGGCNRVRNRVSVILYDFRHNKVFVLMM